MFQPLEDQFKWIRRECRLLDALIKDEKYISESGIKIDKKSPSTLGFTTETRSDCTTT